MRVGTKSRVAGTDDDAGVGRVVADGVVDLAHGLGVAVELLNAGVDDFDGGGDVSGGVEHVVHRHVGPGQWRLEHEGQLHLDTRGDEVLHRDLQHLAGLRGVKHVVEQGAVIRLVDLAADLHGAAGQADLVTDHFSAFGLLQLDPGAANAVAVFNRHAWVAFRKVLDRAARLLRALQLGRKLLDKGVVEHGFRVWERAGAANCSWRQRPRGLRPPAR